MDGSEYFHLCLTSFITLQLLLKDAGISEGRDCYDQYWLSGMVKGSLLIFLKTGLDSMRETSHEIQFDPAKRAANLFPPTTRGFQ